MMAQKSDEVRKRDSRRLYRQYHKTIRLMKKLFRLFLCLALFSGTAACSDDEVSQNLIVINGGEHFLSLDGLLTSSMRHPN